MWNYEQKGMEIMGELKFYRVSSCNEKVEKLVC